MKFTPTKIPDVVLIEPQVFTDSRGSFMETWQAKKFAAAGIDTHFVQANHSTSNQWVLRGLHYQIQQPQGKLVRVLSGDVFDVAVDLRRSSPTFGQWVGVNLSSTNRNMLWVPPGFAHGFLALSEQVEFGYYCTDYYAPQFERSLVWNDPTLKISWPLPPQQSPVLNEKDATAPSISNIEHFA
jgi:dTDP-4-dehydrorhamnose 3,5-epimerase